MRFMLLLSIATPLALAACAEDESTCNELETICAACEDPEAIAQCTTLLKRRDQVDCSLALDDLAMMCGGDGGAADAAVDALQSLPDGG